MTGRPSPWRVVAVLPLVALAAACGGRRPAPGPSPRLPRAPRPRRRRRRGRCAHPGRRPRRSTPCQTAVRQQMDQPFTGDFDAMVKRRVDPRRGDVQPHALLHRPRAGARDHLRGAEGVRDRPQHRPEDRQPQGARGADPDVAESAARGADQGHGRHGRGDGDGAARAGDAGRVLGADPHQRQPGRGHRAGRAAHRHRGRPRRPGRVRPQDRAPITRRSPR